jgi:hypothetical protein
MRGDFSETAKKESGAMAEAAPLSLRLLFA